MKKTILLLVTFIMGLKVYGINPNDYRVDRDGMVFFYNDLNWSQLFSGKDAEGDVVIPDSIYDTAGKAYPVCEISEGAFQDNDKITSVRIANTVALILERAFKDCKNLRTVIIPSHTYCSEAWIFDGCNLDTMVVATPINEVELYGSTIKNLYIERGDTAILGASGSKIGKCYLGDIDHLIIDIDPFGRYCTTYWTKDKEPVCYYSVKAVVVDAIEPPTIEKQRQSALSDPEDMNLRWTILYVPDGSEDKYREAEFWKDFYAVKPLSEMDRYDEYVAEAFAEFSEWAKIQLADIDSPTQDVQMYRVEGDKLLLTGAAEVEVCDLAGRVLERGKYAGGESMTLPGGVSIVSVNGQRLKVAVK